MSDEEQISPEEKLLKVIQEPDGQEEAPVAPEPAVAVATEAVEPAPVEAVAEPAPVAAEPPKAPEPVKVEAEPVAAPEPAPVEAVKEAPEPVAIVEPKVEAKVEPVVEADKAADKEGKEKPKLKVKKKAEKALHRFLPRAFVPLYSMVTFSRVPYGEAVARAARQWTIVRRLGATIVVLLLALLIFGVWAVV